MSTPWKTRFPEDVIECPHCTGGIKNRSFYVLLYFWLNQLLSAWDSEINKFLGALRSVQCPRIGRETEQEREKCWGEEKKKETDGGKRETMVEEGRRWQRQMPPHWQLSSIFSQTDIQMRATNQTNPSKINPGPRKACWQELAGLWTDGSGWIFRLW